MSLPFRTTLEDIQAVCGYLAKKPTGATIKEAKAVLTAKTLDARKLTALKYWGFIEDQERLKLTAKGRQAVKNNGAEQVRVLGDILRATKPYQAIVERVAHRNEASITALDVAAHWHDHFKDDVSKNDGTLNNQAVSFFQIAAGAGLGNLVVGRRGAPTRFEFDSVALSDFVDNHSPIPRPHSEESDDDVPPIDPPLEDPNSNVPMQNNELGQGIFIAHGKNKKPLDQLKKSWINSRSHTKWQSKNRTSAARLAKRFGKQCRVVIAQF